MRHAIFLKHWSCCRQRFSWERPEYFRCFQGRDIEPFLLLQRFQKPLWPESGYPAQYVIWRIHENYAIVVQTEDQLIWSVVEHLANIEKRRVAQGEWKGGRPKIITGYTTIQHEREWSGTWETGRQKTKGISTRAKTWRKCVFSTNFFCNKMAMIMFQLTHLHVNVLLPCFVFNEKSGRQQGLIETWHQGVLVVMLYLHIDVHIVRPKAIPCSQNIPDWSAPPYKGAWLHIIGRGQVRWMDQQHG